MSEMSSEQLARRLGELADAKKAEEVAVLDMRDLVSYTDFLVICTARNERQAGAIVEEVQVRLKRDDRLFAGSVEGDGAAGWVVLDYLDAVLHVQTPDARRRYRLEELWHEAPRLELETGGVAPAATGN